MFTGGHWPPSRIPWVKFDGASDSPVQRIRFAYPTPVARYYRPERDQMLPVPEDLHDPYQVCDVYAVRVGTGSRLHLLGVERTMKVALYREALAMRCYVGRYPTIRDSWIITRTDQGWSVRIERHDGPQSGGAA